MNVFIVENDVVTNHIVADSIERAAIFYPQAICLDSDGTGADLGWGYVDGVFIEPTIVATPKRQLTQLELLLRIPTEKRIAIRAARKTDPVVEDAMDLLDKAEYVSVDDPNTIALVGYLVAMSYLTNDEGAAILA